MFLGENNTLPVIVNAYLSDSQLDKLLCLEIEKEGHRIDNC